MYQIYVEVERARLTHRLAEIKETEGDVAGAAAVMLELQVHAFEWNGLFLISSALTPEKNKR
jgi:hypothetical protein